MPVMKSVERCAGKIESVATRRPVGFCLVVVVGKKMKRKKEDRGRPRMAAWAVLYGRSTRQGCAPKLRVHSKNARRRAAGGMRSRNPNALGTQHLYSCALGWADQGPDWLCGRICNHTRAARLIDNSTWAPQPEASKAACGDGPRMHGAQAGAVEGTRKGTVCCRVSTNQYISYLAVFEVTESAICKSKWYLHPTRADHPHAWTAEQDKLIKDSDLE